MKDRRIDFIMVVVLLTFILTAVQTCKGQTVLKDIPIISETQSYNIYMHYEDTDGKTKWLHESKFDVKNKKGVIVQTSRLSLWKLERVVNLDAYPGEIWELLFIVNDGSPCADSTYVVVHGKGERLEIRGETAIRDENVERDNEINLVNEKKVFVFGEPYENSYIYEETFYGIR